MELVSTRSGLTGSHCKKDLIVPSPCSASTWQQPSHNPFTVQQHSSSKPTTALQKTRIVGCLLPSVGLFTWVSLTQLFSPSYLWVTPMRTSMHSFRSMAVASTNTANMPHLLPFLSTTHLSSLLSLPHATLSPGCGTSSPS